MERRIAAGVMGGRGAERRWTREVESGEREMEGSRVRGRTRRYTDVLAPLIVGVIMKKMVIMTPGTAMRLIMRLIAKAL